MILYLDTSALVKLVVEEDRTPHVRAQVSAVDAVATSRVAYTEACEALARRREEGRLSMGELAEVRQHLADLWPRFAVIELDERAAGDLALKHGLCGYAGAHLAAALALKDKAATAPVVFCSFDARQAQAAVAEGLTVMPG